MLGSIPAFTTTWRLLDWPQQNLLSLPQLPHLRGQRLGLIAEFPKIGQKKLEQLVFTQYLAGWKGTTFTVNKREGCEMQKSGADPRCKSVWRTFWVFPTARDVACAKAHSNLLISIGRAGDALWDCAEIQSKSGNRVFSWWNTISGLKGVTQRSSSFAKTASLDRGKNGTQISYCWMRFKNYTFLSGTKGKLHLPLTVVATSEFLWAT